MNNEGTVAHEQLVINGQEYNPEDAAQLVELGNKYKEMEGKLNTSLDKVYPEYTKATQRNKELEQELAERTLKLEELQKKQSEVEVPADTKAIREAARANGLVDQDLLTEQGYVKRSDLDEYFSQKQTQQQLVDNILTSANKLEQEIDGSDGRAPFDQKAVLAYASAYNIADLREAYDQMNERVNAKWKESQIAKEQRPGLTTLKGGGKKAPETVKVTDDNFKQLWDELVPGGAGGE